MTIDHLRNIDKITTLTQDLEKLKELKEKFEVTSEEVLGYKFKPGDVVRDKTTGKEGIILAGGRKTIKV